jgi:hypothetical protein
LSAFEPRHVVADHFPQMRLRSDVLIEAINLDPAVG